MNCMKWLLLLVFALATVPAEAQGFRENGLNGNRPGPGIMGGDHACVGMVGGPRFGPQPPFGASTATDSEMAAWASAGFGRTWQAFARSASRRAEQF